MSEKRTGSAARKTAETEITVRIDLDGAGKHEIATGIGFFDHMLAQLSRHGLIDLDIKVAGDLHIDGHHTVEDTGLVLGQALKDAIGDKTGINRFGNACVPLDESLSRAVIDLSGRPSCHFTVAFTQERLGEMDTELFREFFHALANSAGLTIHCETLYGENNHHKIESLFKAFARALRMAVALDPRAQGSIPSTKGAL